MIFRPLLVLSNIERITQRARDPGIFSAKVIVKSTKARELLWSSFRNPWIIALTCN